MILDLPQPFAVVAHDVGAANHIIEWLGLERAEYRPFMAGPAGQAWQQRFPARLCHQSLDEALDGARAVLTGTGWGSDLEHRARAAGRSRGLRTVAVLDHWVNYAMRFERPGARVMPDEAWVTDRWAADLARSSFPGLEVKQKPNAYLAAAVREVASRQESAAGTLFVLEPVRDDWGRGFPGEFQALDYFMHRRDVLGIERSEPLRLRPHPSEAPGKYDSWVARHADEGVCLDNSESLFAAISRSRRTVGIQSYALVVADAVGRQAVSTLPPWAPALCLPQPGILELRRLCGESP